MNSGTQDPTHISDRPSQRWGGFSVNQWVMLAVLGGLLLAIGAALALVLRAGFGSLPGAQPTAVVDEDVTRTLSKPPDAIVQTDGLYWPPHPMPLATPQAPGGLLWWDARFAYRRPIHLDIVASKTPAGTWARVILDGERAQSLGKMRADAADVRLLVWNGQQWWEIPRQVRPLPGTAGWELVFQLQGTELASPEADRGDVYHVYYGYPFAESPPRTEIAPGMPALLLELGEEEAVEWGPEVVWRADASTAQTLVSPDGRVTIRCQPAALEVDTRVRLRTVPVSERRGYGSLPEFELHANPPPGAPDSTKVARWDPPLVITINWAGLAVDPGYLETWSHFAYDMSKGVWYNVPVEYDLDRGVIRMTTDQF